MEMASSSGTVFLLWVNLSLDLDQWCRYVVSNIGKVGSVTITALEIWNYIQYMSF